MFKHTIYTNDDNTDDDSNNNIFNNDGDNDDNAYDDDNDNNKKVITVMIYNNETTIIVPLIEKPQTTAQEVDMALGPFSVLYKRSQIIDYSEFLYMDSFGIFLPRPRRERDLSAFVKPLAWQVREARPDVPRFWVVLAGVG